MTHAQDGCLLAFKIDHGREIVIRRRSVIASTEGKVEHWCTELITAYGPGNLVIVPAGSKTALTDIDNREDWTCIAARTH
jgi:hypothetical protein